MLKIKIDDKKLQADLKRLTADLNKEASDSIIEMAQIGATQLAYRCDPYGINKKTQDIAEKAVLKDFNKAYKSLGQTFNELRKVDKDLAMAYARAVHENDLVAAEKYADRAIQFKDVKYSDTGAYLESVRGSKGRVGEVAPMSIVDGSELAQMKKSKVITAGTAKAGWLAAGKSLSNKLRVPKWLNKGKSLGSSTIIKNGWRTIVTLINNVRYTSNVITDGKVKAAVENAYRNQVKKLEKQIEALAKKF